MVLREQVKRERRAARSGQVGGCPRNCRRLPSAHPPSCRAGHCADLSGVTWEGRADGQEHVFGVSPAYEELNWTGLDFSAEQFDKVISIDKAAWLKELQLHAELFQQLEYHLPRELTETKAQIEKRLAA